MKRKQGFKQVSDFDLRLLRLFRTVVQCGSYTAAEGILGISKSAISLQMSDLENRLGMRLCHRGRGGFSLTEEGAEVLRATESLLASVEEFRSEVNQLHDNLRGELNIGVVNNMVTIPEMRVTEAISQLRQLSSGIHINISMSTPAEIEKGLIDGRLHVGIIPFNMTLSGLQYDMLYSEKSCLYCSNRHPLFSYDENIISPDLLAGTDAIFPDYRLPAEAIELHQQFNGSASATDREGIAFLILTGTYIGFLPDHYAGRWVSDGEMKAILPDQISYQTRIAVVTRKNQKHHQIRDHFLSFINL